MFADPVHTPVSTPAGSSIRASTCAWLLVQALAACGGGAEVVPGEDARAPTLIALDAVSPLLDDEGFTMPTDPATIPADGAARTGNGRYASPRQADQLERALGTAVLSVDVACCGIDAAESAIGLAYAHQAVNELPNSTPVLVRSADGRLGAAVANRLLQDGYANVWLVTR